MRFLLSIALCIFIAYQEDVIASKLLEKLNLLGIHSDSLSSPGIEKIALTLFDSISVDLPPPDGGVIITAPRIAERYSFYGMPCLKSYFLQPPGKIIGGSWGYTDYWVLFNTCDTTFYYFASSVDNFSETIRSCLETVINQDKQIELIEFYLNTLTAFNRYYILKRAADFEGIFRQIIIDPSEPTRYSIADWQREQKIVDENVYPIYIERVNQDYHIKLYSWYFGNGNVEYWYFEITPLSFKIIEHKVVLENIGPFIPAWEY